MSEKMSTNGIQLMRTTLDDFKPKIKQATF